MAAKFFYQADTLLSVVACERASRYVRTKEAIICELDAGVSPALLLACELSGTVKAAVSSNKFLRVTYTPYGHRSKTFSDGSQLAFNGEYLHEQGMMYLLGNGYRAYNPGVMRFYSPDSISPFHVLNAYGYCGNDPINKADPSGHIAQQHAIKLKARVNVLKTGIVKMDSYSSSIQQLPATARLKDADAMVTRAKQGIQDVFVEAGAAKDWLENKAISAKYADVKVEIDYAVKQFNLAYQGHHMKVDRWYSTSLEQWAGNQAAHDDVIRQAMLKVRGASNP